jgi:hypothetical protein
MEKHTIINLMNQGKSLRETSRITGISRKAVTRYWKDYLAQTALIEEGGDIRAAQERITSGPAYDTSSRKPKKYTAGIDAAIDGILADEAEKCRLLGITHKQHLTCRQIHAQVLGMGFDIGLTTVTMRVQAKRQRAREAFIRQEYDLGQRLEYDFGEVRLQIGGVVGTYHIAAFGSPAACFRWGFLYANQKKDVFLDSHVRFFKMVGGLWREVVYDNMRNVVSRFIGRSGKELNPDLVKMGMYYGFSINVTNCFAGNEKGYVESAVKWIRNQVFAARYAFDTLDDAREYLDGRLAELNAGSAIEEEKAHLAPARPPLEIARISECVVDKYSFIRVEGGFYSVPDHLVGHTLAVKAYPEEIVVSSAFTEVCRHRRLAEGRRYSVDILHYLDTLARKPGAVKNSVALRSVARLKEVFDARYADSPKDFIVELERLKDLPIDEIADIMASPGRRTGQGPARPGGSLAASIQLNTKSQLAAISAAFLKGGEKVAC